MGDFGNYTKMKKIMPLLFALFLLSVTVGCQDSGLREGSSDADPSKVKAMIDAKPNLSAEDKEKAKAEIDSGHMKMQAMASCKNPITGEPIPGCTPPH
jgi:hypothetical protein